MPRILRHCRVPIMGIRRRPEFFLLWIIMRRKAQRKDSFYLVETNEKKSKKNNQSDLTRRGNSNVLPVLTVKYRVLVV